MVDPTSSIASTTIAMSLVSTSVTFLASPFFARENYDYRAFIIKAFPMTYDLWKVVQTGYDALTTTNELLDAERRQDKERATKDIKVLTFIYSV